MIHREHMLQEGVRVFCGRCVAVPHEFASHDRAQKHSDFDHVFQARRGIRHGWPDTELLLNGGKTFRVELKAPRGKFDEEGRQAEMLTRLNELGHKSTWANSVVMYGEECERFGVPLTGNWRTVAQLIDEHVLAKIRAAQRKSPTKPDKVVEQPAQPNGEQQQFDLWVPRKRRRGQPSIAQIRKAEAGRHLP